MAVVPLDVDLQDPPEALPKMIAKWRAGFDVVYGVRDNRETDSLPKRMTADFYYRAHNWLSRTTRSPSMPAISGCSTAGWSTSSAGCRSATAS